MKQGDVYPVKTEKGYAYIQYILKHKSYQSLIRVLPGLYDKEQEDISSLINKESLFVTFISLKSLERDGILKSIGSYLVPAKENALPIFRDGVVNPKTLKVENWYLWDGEKTWSIGKLSKQQRKLPIKGVWGLGLLIERIENQWTPETDIR